MGRSDIAQRKTQGVKAKPFTGLQDSFNDRGLGIRNDLHIIDKPQVKGFASFGGDRFIALRREGLEYDCTIERRSGTGKRRGYIFTSCDTGAAGVECLTLDEVDEELDNFRG